MTRRLVAVLIALIGTAGVVAVGLSTFFPNEDRVTLTPPGPVRSVEVDLAVGRVTVVPAGTGAATVVRTRKYLMAAPSASETVDVDVLRIDAECPRIVPLGCAVDYRLEVPAGIPVRIRTGQGSVSVADVTGTVDVDTKAGGVRLAGTRGPVRVNTGAGDVDGVDIAVSYLDATTSAGRIRLSLAEPPGRLGLRTRAGSIDVALPAADGGYRVDADAGEGRVDVGFEQNEGGSRTVVARSDAGNIAVRVR